MWLCVSYGRDDGFGFSFILLQLKPVFINLKHDGLLFVAIVLSASAEEVAVAHSFRIPVLCFLARRIVGVFLDNIGGGHNESP